MSIFPKKYHDSDTKCWGYGYCPDCTERIDKGIPLDEGIIDRKINKKLKISLNDITKIEKNSDSNKLPLATMIPECCQCRRPENLYKPCNCSCHNKY